MIPGSNAVEPPRGWDGIRKAQSKIGFQWLHVEDQKLGGNRIKHAGNGKEHTIMLETYGKVRVDGYDPSRKQCMSFMAVSFMDAKDANQTTDT